MQLLALRLGSDVEAVTPRLYRMKNAADKPSEFRHNVMPSPESQLLFGSVYKLRADDLGILCEKSSATAQPARGCLDSPAFWTDCLHKGSSDRSHQR